MKLLMILSIGLMLSACSFPEYRDPTAEKTACVCEENNAAEVGEDSTDELPEGTTVPVTGEVPADLTEDEISTIGSQLPQGTTPSADEVTTGAAAQAPALTSPPIQGAILGNLRFVEYTVEPGDTLSRIANEFGVSIANLQEWNQLEGATIFAGQVIAIGQDISTFLEEQSETVTAAVDFLLHGQDDKTEMERLNWNEGFLNKLDLSALHQQFVDGGGNPEDVENFAIFLTHNAPILDTWQQEFRLQAFTDFQVEITRLEPVGGDDYKAYTVDNGNEVPFAVVSARTGYFTKLLP